MTFTVAAVATALLAAAISAQVLQLTLREMLARVDSAVMGEVVQKTTWRGPVEGFNDDPEFTTIIVSGEDLVTGKQVQREITYFGSDARPVSEMPNERETRVGARGLYFSEPVNTPWGGREKLNSLTTAQNGVFALEAGPKGDVIIGKGEGTAIEKSVFAADLRKEVVTILADLRKGK